MAGLPVSNSPFGRRRSYTAMDDDFFFDDPARYSPPFTDEEYADQLCYHGRRNSSNNNFVDEFLDRFEDVFDEIADDDGEDEQQFPLSMAGTPVTEAPAALKLKPTRRATISTTAQSDGLRPTQTYANLTALGAAMASASSDTTKGGLPRSRPIAIEIPISRRLRSRDPPSAPLSARGDLPGGYFPEHEDPETRIHRPHPFHADATEARRRSIARANEECLSPQQDVNHDENGRLVQTDGAGSMLDLTAFPPVRKASVPEATVTRAEAPAPVRQGSAKDTELPSAAGSSANPPAVHAAYSYTVDESATISIASYNPTGAVDSALPMGKYYPTNWENRKRAKREKKKQKEREARLLREQQAESHGRSSGSHSSLDDDPTPPLEEGPIASTSASGTALAPESTSESASASASGSGKAKRASGSRSGKAKKSSRSAKGKNRAVAPPPPPMWGSEAEAEAEAAAEADRSRRLLQYQRDMVTQTTWAASRVLGSQIQRRGPEEVLQSLNAIPAFQDMQPNQPPAPAARSSAGQAVPALSVSSSSVSSASPASIPHGRGLAAVLAAADQLGMLTKPQSPRLEPLGSPGPVTPIDLSHTEVAANNAGGLLAMGRPKMPVTVATAPPAVGKPKMPAVVATTAPATGSDFPVILATTPPAIDPRFPTHERDMSFPFGGGEH